MPSRAQQPVVNAPLLFQPPSHNERGHLAAQARTSVPAIVIVICPASVQVLLSPKMVILVTVIGSANGVNVTPCGPGPSPLLVRRGTFTTDC
jgi:hypothetical protein